MMPDAQLDALYLRMLGLAFAGQSEPVPKLAEGLAIAEERHGSWCRSMQRRVQALHDEYLAFMSGPEWKAVLRAQHEATKAKEAKK